MATPSFESFFEQNRARAAAEEAQRVALAATAAAQSRDLDRTLVARATEARPAAPIASLFENVGAPLLLPPSGVMLPAAPITQTPVRVGTSVPWDFATDTQAAPPPARAPMAHAPRPAAAPSGLEPTYGSYFDPAKYEAAVASGKLTPQQVTAYEAAKARAGATPLGLTGEGMRIDSAKRKADLVAAGAEQTSLANALERDTKAQEAAAVTEREQIATYEKMRGEFDESQAKRVAEMDAMKTDIAATKIDPSQYFSKGNAFGNVLSLLAVALGGYAEGYSGGRLKNNALAMLQNSIDNDIAAQKANLDNKKSALGAAQSIYGLARQQFGDDQQAAEFTRARQNDVLKTQALRFANEGRTEAIRANATKLAEHLGLESKKGDNAVSLLHANAEQQRIAAAQRGGGGSAQSLEERKFAKERAAEREDLGMQKLRAETAKIVREATGEGEARKDKEVVVFEGNEYLVPKNAARDLQASAGAAEASRGQVDALKELSKHKNYHNVIDSPEYTRGEMIRGNLVAGLSKNLAGGFNPSLAIEERAAGMIKKAPYSIGVDAWEASIEAIPQTAASNVRSQLKSAGAVRVGGDAAAKPVTTYATRK